MKKFFSLLTAVLFAGSMMAVDFTLSSADQVTKDGVTVVFDKGTGTASPAWYDKGLRLYANNTVTITSTTPMTAITFNWEKQGSKDFNTATASTGSYTHPSAAGEGKWTGAANKVVFTLGAAGQLQLNTFSVTLDPDATVDPDPVDPDPVDPDPTDVKTYDVAEAIAAGLQDDDVIMVRGIISKMEIKGANFAKYGSVNIYVEDATDAAGEFEFFNCYSFDTEKFISTKPHYDEESKEVVSLREATDGNGNAIHVGDTVIAYGKYLYFAKNKVHELNTGCYLVDVKSAPQKPAETIMITMAGTEEVSLTDYVAQADGRWQFYGVNDQYEIGICSIEGITAVAGNYTMDELDPEYSSIGIYGANDTTWVGFETADLTVVVLDNGDAVVSGEIAGDDGNTYVVNLSFVKPVAQKTVAINCTDAYMDDTYLGYGLFAVAGMDEEENYVQLAIWLPEDAEDIEGIYSEYDLDYSVIGTYLEIGEEAPEIYTATIVVAATEDGYSINAELLCYDNTLYKVTMTISAEEQGIENVELTEKAKKVVVDGNVFVIRDNKMYNVTGTRVR